MPLTVGLRGEASVEVVPENTAAAAGSGALPVFATPCMIALMEQAAMESVQPFLEEGQGTVGIRIEVSHLAATPVGMTVRAETELTQIDRKRLCFSVKAFAGDEKIGEGTHERFIVNSERFLQKAEAKRNLG